MASGGRTRLRRTASGRLPRNVARRRFSRVFKRHRLKLCFLCLGLNPRNPFELNAIALDVAPDAGPGVLVQFAICDASLQGQQSIPGDRQFLQQTAGLAHSRLDFVFPQQKKLVGERAFGNFTLRIRAGVFKVDPIV